MTKIIPNYFCICRSLKDKDYVRHYGTGNCSLVACTSYKKPIAELQSYDARECVKFIRKHLAANQFVYFVAKWGGIRREVGFVWGTQMGRKEFINHYEE